MKNTRWDARLANQFKKRDNKSYIGAIVGKVVGLTPLTISILNGNAVFQEEKLYVCKSVTNHKEEVSVDINGSICKGEVIHEGLRENDRVMLVATEDNQRFFVIDKI